MGAGAIMGLLWFAKRIGVKSLTASGATFFDAGKFSEATAWIIKEETKLCDMRTELTTKHVMMRTHHLIRDQMNTVEQYLSEVESIVAEVYLGTLAGYCSDEDIITMHPDYAKFQRELEHSLYYLKGLFRYAIKENHLHTKTDQEFADYKKQKIDYIANRMLSWVKRMPVHGCVSIEEFVRALEPRRKEIHDIYSEILDSCRKQSSAYEATIQKDMEEFYEKRDWFYRQLPIKLEEAFK